MIESLKQQYLKMKFFWNNLRNIETAHEALEEAADEVEVANAQNSIITTAYLNTQNAYLGLMEILSAIALQYGNLTVSKETLDAIRSGNASINLSEDNGNFTIHLVVKPENVSITNSETGETE